MLPDEESRNQFSNDKNLAKYLLLCLPFLSYFLVENILDIMIGMGDYDKLYNIHINIEEIMRYSSRSAMLLEK